MQCANVLLPPNSHYLTKFSFETIFVCFPNMLFACYWIPNVIFTHKLSFICCFMINVYLPLLKVVSWYVVLQSAPVACFILSKNNFLLIYMCLPFWDIFMTSFPKKYMMSNTMKIYAQLYITISQRNYFPNKFLISRKESNKNLTKILSP